MSRRKVAYAKKNCIDPEEEGEELPFKPREVTVNKDRWITKGYTIGELLGRGKFGEVKKCEENSTGLKLAAKFIAIQCDSDRASVLREIELQSKLHHTKVLQLYDAYEKDRQMCIVMELVEGGELFDRVVDPKFDLTERVAILFMRQIVDAMSFIHSQGIIHLDMKPENIVCVATKGTRIKIIDFGLALSYTSGCGIRTMAGTLEFMAPEVANFEDVSPATDMWSVGVICYVIVSGLSPFLGDNDNETTSNVLRCKYDFDAEEFDAITEGCKDFIRKLLIKNPKERLSAAECMKHSWLQRITRAQTTRHLSKKFHVKFFARRKWKKAMKAVIAMNRLEKYSQKFMTRKSNTDVQANFQSRQKATNRVEPQAIDTKSTKKVEPQAIDTKYDWKANLEARKKQRGLDKRNENSHSPADTKQQMTAHDKNIRGLRRVNALPIHQRWQQNDTGAKDVDKSGHASSTAASRDRVLNKQKEHHPVLDGISNPRRRNIASDITGKANTTQPSTRQGRLAAMTAGRRF